ncbi:phage shock protein C (PspC) family protein [Paenibacillus taihuensis]|uniref:Phage shock protein C (PspC) family protein n=1 Tax=Paenibacillus taihuensis TaxID=1156355 RepID=A0A3D9S408_9BACL|nr:PspC domain-containing protein [Paenibacillus taihuensis]REE87518.1 phage shock protein C (PspC) family protein [Paenibacillus taihuensis]
MKKLYRSRRDKKLFGLCGGLAEMLNVDATLLRILLIVITVFTSGALILIYILAGLVVPKDPYQYGGYGQAGHNGNWNNGHFGGGHGGQGGHGFGGTGGFGSGGPYTNPPQPGPGTAGWQQAPSQTSASNIDAMMDDLEKRALRKEIEELRAKLAKHEKGEF